MIPIHTQRFSFSGLLAVILVSLTSYSYGQNASDSVTVVTEQKDTVQLKSYATRYDPRKALLYAAVLPGLGQVYNKKYWKLPLVYGGFIGIGYGMKFYQDGYTKYRAELFQVIDTQAPTSPSGFSQDQLRTIVDRYRRERDFMIVLMAGMYILQIVDAHVDAHLKEFDLNPNLQVRFEPSFESDMLSGRSAGFAVKLRF